MGKFKADKQRSGTHIEMENVYFVFFEGFRSGFQGYNAFKMPLTSDVQGAVIWTYFFLQRSLPFITEPIQPVSQPATV